MIENIVNVIPWRFRSMHNLRLTYANTLFRKVITSPSISCNPTAATEVHSLVCKRDLNMYLMASKSFLQYYDNVRIVAHDDGTLGEGDFDLLRSHIRNIKIIPRHEADTLIAKAMKPELFRIRNECFFMLKVFDFNFFNEGQKTILLDSDIVFIGRPDEVIAWISDGNSGSFYNADPTEDTFRSDVKDITTRLGHFNSGFIGYPGKFSMETLCHATETVKCFFEDQTIYSFLLGSIGSVPLERRRYFVHDGSPMPREACMVHFMSSHRFSNSLYLRLARKVTNSLQQAVR